MASFINQINSKAENSKPMNFLNKKIINYEIDNSAQSELAILIVNYEIIKTEKVFSFPLKKKIKKQLKVFKKKSSSSNEFEFFFEIEKDKLIKQKLNTEECKIFLINLCNFYSVHLPELEFAMSHNLDLKSYKKLLEDHDHKSKIVPELKTEKIFNSNDFCKVGYKKEPTQIEFYTDLWRRENPQFSNNELEKMWQSHINKSLFFIKSHKSEKTNPPAQKQKKAFKTAD